MKYSLIIAITFYSMALARIIDWFIFCNKYSVLQQRDYLSFKQLYINHFPDYIQPLVIPHPEPATIISVILFLISGLIFNSQGAGIYKAIGISAFIFAGWNLFSLM